MNLRFPVVGTVLAIVLSGCIGAGPTGPEQPVDAAATAPVAPQELVLSVLTWDGYARAGAASEIPAHFEATEKAVEPVWKTGFNLQVHELPSVVEIRVDWTSATPSQVMFMAHVANNPDDHRDWVEYEYPKNHATEAQWPTQGPLCMRITTEELAPGHWHIMSHTRYGGDVQIKFTITTVGGHAEVPTGLHGHTLDAEEGEQLMEYVHEPQRDWEPCQLSGDDVRTP